MGPNKAMIDCERKLVRVKILCEGELVIHDKELHVGQVSVQLRGLGDNFRRDAMGS